MGKTMSNSLKKIIITAAVIAALTAGVLIIVPRGTKEDIPDIQKGIDYIKNREKVNVTEIEDKMFQNELAEMLAEIDSQIEEDPDYVWTALSQINTVFMGDSRVDAYSAFGFVESSRCLADRGASIRIIPDHYEELKVINPKLLVLEYGLNDVQWLWDTPEEFAEEMMGYVDEIRGFLPDCKIYIQSTLYPRDRESVDAMYNFPELFELVKEWNTTAKALYLENGYDYLELGALVEENQDLYQPDGVHFDPSFYPLWAKTILKQYMADSMVRE